MSEDHSGEYQEILEFALRLAEEAAALIRQGAQDRWTSVQTIVEKKNSVDLVTVVDQKVENVIKSAIAERYPSHEFIGEESWDAGERDGLTDEFTWIVDPIDGTMNFVHNNPFIACSIGVTHNSEPVVGVVAQPFLNRTFSARKGGGAFMDRSIPLPLTGGIAQPLTALTECMIAAEWGSDRTWKTMKPKSESFVRLAGNPKKGVEGGIMCHALRTTGSSVCNIIAVAAGEFDMYWDAGCYAWDMCAGVIILKETGGYFSGGRDAIRNASHIRDILMNRRYIAIRAVPSTQDETSEEVQKRLISEMYDVVDEWTNEDM